MDGQYEPLRGDLAEIGIQLSTVSNDEHVPEIVPNQNPQRMNMSNLLHPAILQNPASFNYRNALCGELLAEHVPMQGWDIADNEPVYTSHRLGHELQQTLPT